MKRSILFFGVILSCLFCYGQEVSSVLSDQEITDLHNAMEQDTLMAQFIGQFGDPVRLYENFKTNTRISDSIWARNQKNLAPVADLGTTERFELIPLIESMTDDPELSTEAGVSYLIRTDEATILFDVGQNATGSHPSPLLKNMERLGIELDDIDMIVISHNHGDHVGGRWAALNTFSLSGRQIDLDGKVVYTPVEMTYPGLDPVYSPNPVKIAEGVASVGVIQCPMFVTNVGEQSLAINVKDRGIVIVSGCGHQTIEKMVLRSEKLFDESLYALIGGLHLPVTVSRHIGIYYSWLVTGKLPWDSLKKEDVEASIAFMKEHGIKVAGLSSHDSCDWSLNAFKQAFQDRCVEIKAGQKISL